MVMDDQGVVRLELHLRLRLRLRGHRKSAACEVVEVVAGWKSH